MERCLHPDLAKRAYLPGVDGKPQLSRISALNLIQLLWELTPEAWAKLGGKPWAQRGVTSRRGRLGGVVLKQRARNFAPGRLVIY